MVAVVVEPASSLFSDLLPILGILLVVVIAGGVIIYLVRRTASNSATPSQGFTLHELRELRRTGELSDAEFEKAKETVIGLVKDDTTTQEPGNPPTAPD
jgi:hypothetical protein